MKKGIIVYYKNEIKITSNIILEEKFNVSGS